PKERLYLMVVGFELVLGFMIDLKNDAILYRDYEHCRRRLRNVAVIICYPPIFDRKLDGMVVALFINDIRTEHAFKNIVLAFRAGSRLNNKLLLFHLLQTDPG